MPVEYTHKYLWAIRRKGENLWRESASSGNIQTIHSLDFSTTYEVRARIYGTIKDSLTPQRLPRTEDFREVEAWRRLLTRTAEDYLLDDGPTTYLDSQGYDRSGVWIIMVATDYTYATNWSDIVEVTTVALPVPSTVANIVVTDEDLYVDPVTGITLASVKVTWDNNAESELVDAYEVLWYD